eukprot:403367887
MDGFEKGMMERDNEDVFFDSDCDMVKPENKDLGLILNFANMYRNFMSSVKEDNPLSRMFDTVTYFIENLGQMINIFTIYEGSDYCAGLNFGITGAYILNNVADSFRYVEDIKSKPDKEGTSDAADILFKDRKGYSQNKELQSRESSEANLKKQKEIKKQQEEKDKKDPLKRRQAAFGNKMFGPKHI